MNSLILNVHFFYKCFYFFIATGFCFYATSTDAVTHEFPYKQINLSKGGINISQQQDDIIISIIDDGFDFSNPIFNGMIWKNPEEIPQNEQDDDGNGYIDDVNGWDFSDMNADISPIRQRIGEFYHGTQSASVIAQILRIKLGKLKDYPIKLMLIKAISDSAQKMYIKNGYEGIHYAVENNALIISNSWSGGRLKTKDLEILNSARNRGVFIINSAGNYYIPEPTYPAVNKAVFVVAGIDSNYNLMKKSNYGDYVDISAPGKNVRSLHPGIKKTWGNSTGTSLSTPMIAATAALMKLTNPALTLTEIKQCLKNSAFPLDKFNPKRAGRMGAGSLNIDGAIDCASHPKLSNMSTFNTPAGTVVFNGEMSNTSPKNSKWIIDPIGEYKGLGLSGYVTGSSNHSSIHIKSLTDQKTLWQGMVSEFPNTLKLQASKISIELLKDPKDVFFWHYNFKADPINFSQRYCRGTQTIKIDTLINDGSLDHNYEADSSCKWFIDASYDKIITIKLIQLDIEQNVDYIHIFRGDSTRKTDFLFSATGDKLPPTIIIRGGPALVWFVSSNKIQGQGFSAKITISDDLEYIKQHKIKH